MDKVQIKGYQCWKDLSIVIHPFTVIVGSSGLGKSSILRALESVYSCSTGLGSVEHNSKTSLVDLSFDRFSVQRIKSKKYNMYKLILDDGIVVFDKVGRTTPPEIEKVLNFPVVEVSDRVDKLFYSSQFDSPFMLAESGGYFASVLITLLGVGDMLEAQRKLEFDRRYLSHEISASENRVNVLEEDLIYKARMKALDLWDQIQPLLDEAESIQLDFDHLSGILENEPPVPWNLIVFPEIQEVQELRQAMDSMPVEVAAPPPLISTDAQQSCLEQVLLIRESILSVVHLIGNLEEKVISISKLVIEVDILQREFDSIVGVECPLCGGSNASFNG